MARFVSVLGFLDGKLQNTVTATVKGQSTIRAYQPNVSNPATEKQVSNRDVMTYITNLANSLNFAVLVPFLTPKLRVQSPINSFNSQLGRLITLIAIDEGIIRSEVLTTGLSNLLNSNLMVANGPKSFIATNNPSIDAGTTTSTTAGATLSFQMGNYSRADLATDVVVFVAVNVSNPNPPAVTITTAQRSTGSLDDNITLPTRADTDIVLIFAFFKGLTDNVTSKGMVIGRLIGTGFEPTSTRTYVA